jgi:hypothetical protein
VDTARAVLTNWDAEWIAERQRRGRTGGQRSKRPPTWTDLDVRCLPPGTIAQQAKLLKRSTATIERMRRRLRELDPGRTGGDVGLRQFAGGK